MKKKIVKKCSQKEIFDYSRKMVQRAAVPLPEEQWLFSIINYYEEELNRKLNNERERNLQDFNMKLEYGLYGKIVKIIQECGVPCDANDVCVRLNDPNINLSQTVGILEQLTNHKTLNKAYLQYNEVYKVTRAVYYLPEWEERLRNEVQL